MTSSTLPRERARVEEKLSGQGTSERVDSDQRGASELGCRHEGTRVDVVHCEKKMSNHAIRWAGSAIAAIWT